MQRRVSMADVAAAAGVSSQTVSRVANASPRVDPETRARVEAAMDTLGYRVHRAARALRTGRTQTVGLVVSTLATVGNSRMLQAISTSAAARGYAVTVVTAAGPEDVADGFARLREQGVDGAIVLNEATPSARDADVPAGMRLVVIDSPPDPRFDVVVSDHAAGAREATRFLLDRGADTVWHLAGPAGPFAASERERGWREALSAAGATAPDPVRGDWTSASGYRAADVIPREATAVFVGNDQMALGALRRFSDQGRRVPEEVAVVGFDDVVDAGQFRPPLTTVRQDFDALGETALARLIAGIETDATPTASVIPARLVVRASA